MKHPVLVALAVAAAAGGAYALTRNGKSTADRLAGDVPKRPIHPIYRLMHEEFGSGPGRHDPSEAIAAD